MKYIGLNNNFIDDSNLDQLTKGVILFYQAINEIFTHLKGLVIKENRQT